jgi:LAS superfamily LD-carboxypeptidase LdcB
MKFPVKKIRIPGDLTGQINGKVNDDILKTIKPSGELHNLAADAWTRLRQDAATSGVELIHVGAYRTYLRQYQMFRTRYSKTPTGRNPEVTRIWNGSTWYLRKGCAPTATPGKSNHGLGLAIDAALKVGGKTYPISADPDGPGPLKSGTEWLRKNAVKHGWCWEISDSSDPNFEAWHLVYFAGDNTQARPRPTNTPRTTEGHNT